MKLIYTLFVALLLLSPALPAAAILEEDMYGSGMESDGGGSLLALVAMIAFCYLTYLWGQGRGFRGQNGAILGVFVWFPVELVSVLVLKDAAPVFYWLVIGVAAIAFAFQWLRGN